MLCATEKPEYGIIDADIIKKRWVKVQQHNDDVDRISLKKIPIKKRVESKGDKNCALHAPKGGFVSDRTAEPALRHW